MQRYFKEIENKTKVAYSVAEAARRKGIDPKSVVEISLATSLAGRAVALVSSLYPQLKNTKIEKRIKELEKEYGFLDPAVCLKIAEEVAKEKFCKFKDLKEAIEAGARIAFAYYTLGVVVPPIEGFTHLEIRKTRENKQYFAAFFSGPIRAAGSTAAAFFLVILDYLRELFGYAKYDPTEEEIKRSITEVYDYHEKVTNLQYLASKKELEFLLKNLPIQIEGLPSEEKEVSNYKDLERVNTNRIRGGVCLVLSESLAQKAAKLLRIINKLKAKGFTLSSWNFLEEFVEKQKEMREMSKKEDKAIYIADAVAGRPVFSYPSRSGGFRLRYGRTRMSGYSAVAINPATMILVDNFIAIGTQLKLERPSKAAAITPCSTIDGPIVKLEDGSVVKVNSVEKAMEVKDKVKEIIYLGDILISYGDFFNRNHNLLPCGYNHEYWLAELKETAIKWTEPEKLADKKSTELEEIQKILEKANKKVSLDEALKISNFFDIPLHPDYIFYWSQITFEQFLELLKLLSKSKIEGNALTIQLEEKESKRALELLGVEHRFLDGKIIIEEETARALALNIGIKSLDEISQKAREIISKLKEKERNKDVLTLVNELSFVKIKDKAGTFIGARMGRPEKAKPRELRGSPNVLFPVGQEGGRLRSVQEAINKGYVDADFPIYYCPKCNKETIYFVCHRCGSKTKQLFYCQKCRRKISSESCLLHGKEPVKPFLRQKINIKEYFEAALKKLNLNVPIPIVKGVRGTSSKNHVPENIAKGILRAVFNLHVNKDGTIRYDSTEIPLTHFKPKEINVSVEKLRELGYTHDIFGKELKDEDQIVELKPHDVILPCYSSGNDEPASDFFFRVSKFVDSELVHLYGMKPFYNLKTKEDLVGHLLLCIAPHNCAGVVARIIGFSNTQAFIASPYLHAAMRRDADGDEAAMMLLLDALLNFSREYLPAHRGSTQDAPLILNVRIRPSEVDDMIFDMDVVKSYPLELYMAAEKKLMPTSVKIEQVSDRIKESEFDAFKNLNYTHEVEDINEGVRCSNYKVLATMAEKLEHEMELAEKLRAIEISDVAKLIIDRHFIRDIKGNFAKFAKQQFRCVNCNEKYRRPPLEGKCLKCKEGRIIFTIAEGFIVKYLETAIKLAEKYDVDNYTKQNLRLLKNAIEGIFGKEREKQQNLEKWF